MQVYKYPLVLTEMQKVPMPVGAQILTAQLQHGEICLWARVDPASAVEERIIRIVGTGNGLVKHNDQYIATVQQTLEDFLSSSVLVWHIFEVK